MTAAEWQIAGAAVLSATLVVRSAGAWVVDVEVDTEQLLTGAVDLVVGTATWRGFVDPQRGGLFEGRWSGRVVGGAGGLARVLPARFYRSVPARVVARDLCAEAGEQLAADAVGLDVSLPLWARRRESFAAGLSRLCGVLGRTWRVDPAGLVTTSPWPALAAPEGPDHLSDDPREGTATYATDGLDLLPGMALDERTITTACYTLSDGGARAEVAFS